MKKAKLPLDLQKLTPNKLGKAMKLRDKAKSVTAKRMHSFINSKLGMLIDGTGKNYNKIANMTKMLKAEGYDCYMVFVNTDLDVALERNRQRDRTLPEDLVKKSWKEVNNNMGKFQTLFGADKMLVVDNSEHKEFANMVKSKAREFVRRPIQNHIAKQWIKKELEMRKS
jgi:predicted kinase